MQVHKAEQKKYAHPNTHCLTFIRMTSRNLKKTPGLVLIIIDTIAFIGLGNLFLKALEKIMKGSIGTRQDKRFLSCFKLTFTPTSC